MAPEGPAPTLGDSWVVSELDETTNAQRVMPRHGSLHIENNSQEAIATSASQEALTPLSSFSESEFLADYQDPEPPDPTTPQPDVSESASTFASLSSSGPELVMPSIMFESSTTNNASWVIPRKRSKQPLYESRKAPKVPKQHIDSPQHEAQQPTATGALATTSRHASGVWRHFTEMKNYVSEKLDQNHFIRMLLNSFFLLIILHLLILPEILYQVPSLCQVSTASRLYPRSCVKSNRTSSGIPGVSSKFQSAIRTQIQLQDYLNHTIQEFTPLEESLKDSDMVLRDLYTNIRAEYAGARNEIDLEFQGVWAASRSISRALMAFKVDTEAVVNTFQSHKSLPSNGRTATGIGNSKKNIFSRIMSRDTSSEAEKQEASGLALTNRLSRLDRELDTIIARLGQKTESLLVQLAKLDDHLESMKEIVTREHQRLGQDSNDPSLMNVMWKTLTGVLSGSSDSSGNNKVEIDSESLSELERISSYHRLMADVIGKLDKELKALQKIRSIRA